METLDLAVVIPTYDRPALLRETLDSVLAQTVRPREIVVVDNGHGDETSTLLERDYRGQVTALRMTPQGVQAARNLGVQSTSTRWVATLDDDDLWPPDYLQAVASVMQDGRADLIFGDHRKFGVTADGDRYFTPQTNAEQAPSGYWEGVPQRAEGESWTYLGQFPPERLIWFVGFYPSTMVIRRDLLERIGPYDVGLRGNRTEDVEFAARALAHGRTAMIWRPLVLYRVHDSNTVAGDYLGIRLNKWELVEYMHAHDGGRSARLEAALERELPVLRADVFDLAFRYQDEDVLDRVTPLLRPQEWTAKRRLKRAVQRLPPSVRTPLVHRLVRAGVERDEAVARRAFPQPPA